MVLTMGLQRFIVPAAILTFRPCWICHFPNTAKHAVLEVIALKPYDFGPTCIFLHNLNPFNHPPGEKLTHGRPFVNFTALCSMGNGAPFRFPFPRRT